MKEIKLPFKSKFEAPLKSGTKTLTARTKKYGETGDYFYAFGEKFTLTEVFKMELWYGTTHWKDEGCASIVDFINTWEEIHPKKKYDPKQMVWFHRFKKE